MSAEEDLIAYLVGHGWRCEPAAPGVVERLLTDAEGAAIPAGHAEFLRNFASLTDAAESAWFLSAVDYAGESDDAFAWNEFEMLSLESAMTDDERRAIEAFWEEFLPIALSVAGDYEFLAISRRTGRVVHGSEPEFEVTTPLADDLASFAEAVVAGRLDPPVLRGGTA